MSSKNNTNQASEGRSGFVDALNQARALRVAEIMNDFRTVQLNISSMSNQGHDPISVHQQLSSYGEAQDWKGHTVMHTCSEEAQVILNLPFSEQAEVGKRETETNAEDEMKLLQRVILDASVRRFMAHKIYLKMSAARRWQMAYERIVQAQQSTSTIPAVNAQLDEELKNVNDSYVFYDLRSVDVNAGYWIDEDPGLETILQWMRTAYPNYSTT